MERRQDGNEVELVGWAWSGDAVDVVRVELQNLDPGK